MPYLMHLHSKFYNPDQYFLAHQQAIKTLSLDSLPGQKMQQENLGLFLEKENPSTK